MRYASLRDGLQLAICPSVSGGGVNIPDVSGRGNHSTLTNMGANGYTTSRFGVALSLDGISNFIQTPISLSANGDFTFSGRFRTSQTSEGNLFSNNAAQSGRCDFKATSLNGSIYTAFFFLAGTSNVTLFGTSATNNGLWNTFSVTRINTLFSLYVNGILEATASSANAISSTTFRIGASASTTQLLSGLVDDVRVYARALAEAEVQLLASESGLGLRPERTSVFFGAQLFNAAWARNSNVIISPVGAA